MVALRAYQEKQVTDVRMAMRTSRRVLMQSPTGSGKTVVFSHMAERVWSNAKRVYALAHRIEIVNQISKSFAGNNVRHGVMAPERRETSWPVQCCMVQTLANRLDRIPKPDLLIVDEAHHAVSETYLRIMRHWEGVHTLLVTATPQRLDGRGLAEVADVLVPGPPVRWLIDNGFLAPFRYIAPPVTADLSSLKVKMGDFVPGQVADAVDRREVIGDVEAHYREYFAGAPAVVFCPNVASSHHMAQAFAEKGWRAAAVDGKTDPDERRALIDAIGTGQLQALFSCSIIDEGTDLPEISGVINCAPTMSLTRYLQRVGRALRVKKDGRPAIIVDHVNDRLRHGMPDFKHRWSLEGRKKGSAQRAPATRNCPKCYLCFPPAPKCPDCGYVFPALANVGIPAGFGTGPGQLTELQQEWLRTGPYKDVLRAAVTREQLVAVQKARGYEKGWVDLQLAIRAGFRGGNAPVRRFGRFA